MGAPPKNSLCVAVMIFNIHLQVNDEYSDFAIDYTCANTTSELIAIILFLLTVFSVFLWKYAPISHQHSLGKQTIKRNNLN